MTLYNLRTDIKINKNKMQSNFETIAATPFIIPNKTTSERIALTASAGLKVYDTTLLTFFIGNGSNWVEV